MLFKNMKTKDLIELVKGCHDSVYITDCFGTRDLINLDRGSLELEKRGYTIKKHRTISIKKE